MRLHSLEVDHFRAIQSARITFGPGLNVVHGPNDLGKSTLTEAIRAGLLVSPGSAESRSFTSWGAAIGQSPRVLIAFECQGATWRVEKVFAQGSKGKACLEKSTDGGVRYHVHAQGRDVEGKLRGLLNWGLAAPGGRSISRSETYLTTALLGKQGEVSAIFEASLKGDHDETGRELVTRALDALGQDPTVTRLLDRLKERSGEVYTASGRHKRTADSPLVRARAVLNEREDRLRELQDLARQGKEIEEEVCRRLRARETALDLRDHARAEFEKLRGYKASAAQRDQLENVVSQRFRDFERIAGAFQSLEAARQEHLRAEEALTAVAARYDQAVQAATAAEAAAQASRDRLARARSAHESSKELASSARAARLSDLRVQLERAVTRTAAARAALAALDELASLESQLAAARGALGDAEQDLARASAELALASTLEDLRAARALTDAVETASAEQVKHTALELAASAAVNEADAAVTAAAQILENEREAEKQSRRAADERATQAQLLDARILHCEATVRDEREALDRAKTAVIRMRRADEAQVELAAAEATAAEIDVSLAANAAEIARCEAKLYALETAGMELRRRAIAMEVDELRAQEETARDHRRRAADVRERAARLEAEVAATRLPSSQQLSALRALHSEIKSRKVMGPVAKPSPVLPLLVGSGSAAVGFVATRYGVSAGIELSIGAALLLGIVGIIVGVASVVRQKRNVQRSWQLEIDRLEKQLEVETRAVLVDAGVGTLEEIESKRQRCESLHVDTAKLRQEATDLDRNADSMFERSSSISSLRRELATLTDQLAERHGGAPSLTSEVAADRGELNANILREQERLEEARRAREALQTVRFRQVALCVSKRAQAESALAERQGTVQSLGEAQMAVTEAESRLREAEAQLLALRQERMELTVAAGGPPAQASQGALALAKENFAQAEAQLQDQRRKRRQVADEKARADARLELARQAVDGISLPEIERRVMEARASVGADVEPGDPVSARARQEHAKEQVSSASAKIELLAARIPAARRKSEELGSAVASDASAELKSAEQEESRLAAILRETEAETQPINQVSASTQELEDAVQTAAQSEQALTDTRARAEAATAERDRLRGSAERARGEFEACERVTVGLDLEQAERELAEARQALADLHPVPEVTPDQLLRAESVVRDSEDALKACEGSLNEVRGKLELVAGRVGIERIEEEEEAVQRAKEHAEDQELDYEASKYLLEALEAAETKRASHLGRCLATPVSERFLALTGDLYAHVNLDPDLRLEGFVSVGGQHSVEELSVGTREQLATIVRLAIAAQLKTAVLLDDQLVHSDSGRIEWFRKQVRNSVREHDHQVIVMTCRLSDYAVDDEINSREGEPFTNGSPLKIINVLDVVRRVRPPASHS
jgi:DNA repair exonuclease SbcCD ATPase subunit